MLIFTFRFLCQLGWATLFFLSCDSPYTYIIVKAPVDGKAHPALLEPQDYALELSSSAGRFESLALGAAQGLAIRVSRGEYISITARPLLQNALQMRPAGLFLHFSPSTARVQRLAWEDGFLAQITSKLIARNYPIKYLNIARLQEQIALNIVKYELNNAPDPWNLDAQFLLEKLAEGDLRWYYIKKKSRFYIDEFPPGTWISNDPFILPINYQKDTSPRVKLAWGDYQFANLEFSDYFNLNIGENGRVIIW